MVIIIIIIIEWWYCNINKTLEFNTLRFPSTNRHRSGPRRNLLRPRARRADDDAIHRTPDGPYAPHVKLTPPGVLVTRTPDLHRVLVVSVLAERAATSSQSGPGDRYGIVVFGRAPEEETEKPTAAPSYRTYVNCCRCSR